MLVLSGRETTTIIYQLLYIFVFAETIPYSSDAIDLKLSSQLVSVFLVHVVMIHQNTISKFIEVQGNNYAI